MSANSTFPPQDTDDKQVYFESANRMLSFSYGLAVLLLITNILIVVLTFVGNSIVILLIIVYEQLRVPANLFLANLAVVDLLNGLVLQLLHIITLFRSMTMSRDREKMFTPNAISYLDAVGLTILYANVSTLCLITTDRYIAIKHSLKYISIVTIKRVNIAIVSSWITGLIVGVASAFLFPVQNRERTIPFVILVIGAIFVTTIYVKIHKISIVHSRKIRAEQLSVNPDLRQIPIERRGLRTVVLITISLFVSYLPLTLVALEKRFFGSDISEYHLNAQEAFFQIGIVLLFLKSAVNPLLYFFRNEKAKRYTCKMYKTVRAKVTP